MPELPEVEITCRGIAPHLEGRRVDAVVIRNRRLRWPIPPDLAKRLAGRRVRSVRRRGKYLLLECETGVLLIHLGMSGSLRIVPTGTPPALHDHFDLVVGSQVLRLRDPRRFGAVLWAGTDPLQHKLLAHLGVEPLSEAFGGEMLHRQTRRRRQAIKQVLMDHRLVVGVGNIYANESLFRAGIRPRRAACRLTRADCDRLVAHVRATLEEAIAAGGSSLRDFLHSDGSAGYFQQTYYVYGRADCRACGGPVRRVVQGQRATFYCPGCQR